MGKEKNKDKGKHNAKKVSGLSSKVEGKEIKGLSDTMESFSNQDIIVEAQKISETFKANKSLFDTSAFSKAFEFNRELFDTSSLSKTFETNKSLIETSALSKAFESSYSLFDNSELSKALESSKSLFESSALSKAFESNYSLFENSELSKTLESSKSLFESSALSKAFESNYSLFENSELSKALETSKSLFESSALSKTLDINHSLFDNSGLSKVLETNKSLFDTSALSKAFDQNSDFFKSIKLSSAFEFGEELINTSVFANSFESTYKLFDNNYFNETFFDSSLISQISNTVSNFREHFDDFKAIDINRILPNFNINETELSLVSVEGNTLKISNEQYDLIRIRNLVKDVLDESGISSIEANINESINKLIIKISELSDSKLKSIVFGIITQLLLGVLLIITAPRINELSEKYIFQNPKPVVKKIDKIVKNTPPTLIQNLKDFRFITINILNVRERPNQKSKVVGKLYLGYLVKFIKIKKSWMLVEYQNSDLNILVRGWVFSRYAKKIN